MPSVYLLHIDPPYQHAKHYVGWTPNGVKDRIKLHQRGQGARLCEVAVGAGRKLILARVWHHADWKSARAHERKLKRNSHVPEQCPICNPKQRPKYARLPVRSEGSEV